MDQKIHDIMNNSSKNIIMVSHPAYAYFARDYGLTQLSIEFEGRDPTPQQLTRVLEQARKAKIKKIFIQMQYNAKGARLIAKELGAEVVTLDPYSKNYFESMIQIANQFANQ
jgi:zinc transport system substrate-binding protein